MPMKLTDAFLIVLLLLSGSGLMAQADDHEAAEIFISPGRLKSEYLNSMMLCRKDTRQSEPWWTRSDSCVACNLRSEIHSHDYSIVGSFQ